MTLTLGEEYRMRMERWWQQCLDRYVVPALPGEWAASGALLYRAPAEWLMCGVVMSGVGGSSSSFRLSAVVQSLPEPNLYITGPHLLLLRRGPDLGNFAVPSTVEDAEPMMREVLELIRGQALPYLDATGNLPGYIAATEKLALEQPANFLYHATLFYARLATGDINGAQQAATAFDTAAALEPVVRTPWLPERRTHIAHIMNTAHHNPAAAQAILREQAHQTRTALGIT
jgi:hypothetical protein